MISLFLCTASFRVCHFADTILRWRTLETHQQCLDWTRAIEAKYENKGRAWDGAADFDQILGEYTVITRRSLGFEGRGVELTSGSGVHGSALCNVRHRTHRGLSRRKGDFESAASGRLVSVTTQQFGGYQANLALLGRREVGQGSWVSPTTPLS